MFSIFEKIASISIKIRNIFSFSRINSPNINLGRGNLFLKQGIEIKPRSRGPYLLVKNNRFEKQDKEWINFSFGVANLGSEPANNAETRTEIYVNNELKFKSPVSASSIIPPDFVLDVMSQDPAELVTKCTLDHPENKFIFIVEYTDLNGNKFITLKSLYFAPIGKKLSNRDEKAFRIGKNDIACPSKP